MNKTKEVRIVPYDPVWKIAFESIRAELEPHIGDLVLAIEHVGSTSVEGLGAKPVIDIDVVMDSYEVFPAIVERLEKAGFGMKATSAWKAGKRSKGPAMTALWRIISTYVPRTGADIWSISLFATICVPIRPPGRLTGVLRKIWRPNSVMIEILTVRGRPVLSGIFKQNPL